MRILLFVPCLKQIRYFLAIADQGGFTQAAVSLFVALPPERLWVVLPEDHPLACHSELRIADLEPEAFVSAVHRERGGLARRVTDLCLGAGFTPRMAPVVSRKTSILDLVAAGLGIAVVPEGMTCKVPAGVVYRPLGDENSFAKSALVLPRHPAPLTRCFVRITGAA